MKNRNVLGILFLAVCLLLFSGLLLVRLLRTEKRVVIQEVKRTTEFAKYEFIPSKYTAKLPDYPLSLPELSNFTDFEKVNRQKFTPGQIEALKKQHFFIAANLDKFYEGDPNEISDRHDDWTYLYGNIGGDTAPQSRQPENAVFVTTDFLLHVYHRLLEKEFEYIEQRKFYPKLKKISDTLLDQSLQAYQAARTPAQKDSFARLVAYFAVPAVILKAAWDYHEKERLEDAPADAPEIILGNLEKIKDKLPAGSYTIAKEELALVLAANQIVPSPLLGRYQAEQNLSFPEDYTQYGPRSHYNKNPVLRTYFRAMIWYGRVNFLLKSPELTRDAGNITLLLEKADLLKDWEDLYLTTAFFVGESDDLGFYEYRQALMTVAPNVAPKELSEALVLKLQATLAGYRKPRIMSSVAFGERVFDLSKEELQEKTKGFRFLGQRFTADAFIFSSLTQGDERPDPQTGERLPSTPTALMVMSLLGNKTAAPLLAKWTEKNAPASKMVLQQRMSELTKHFNKLTMGEWTQNIYWAWLYTLTALFQEEKNKTGYPMFMKSNDWSLKNLQCSLGSWTELKHDTLLYAKQAYAEMGAGEEEKEIPPVPKGYVEPNLDFFDRLISLIRLTKDGLAQRGLLDNIFREKHDTFLEEVEFFRKIAIAELQNDRITDEDFERLRLASGYLGWVVSPLPSEQATENHARAALIADVHTDIVKSAILYEAVGIPNYIYVAVKDQNGTRLTKGLVFSYYEFTQPLGQRLTDEQWRQWVYTADKSRVPEMPEWSKSLLR